MIRFAKLFETARGQAVRLPRGFRFSGDKVRIRRVGNSVLQPVYAHAHEWFKALKSIRDDPDFLKRRNQPKVPKRKILK